MARAKARFNRDPDLADILSGRAQPLLYETEFTELRRHLREMHPRSRDASSDGGVFDPVASFVGAVISEVRWAQAELRWNETTLRKDEIEQELKTLATKLGAAARFARKYPGKVTSSSVLPDLAARLRMISRDVDLLLGIDADPRSCADSIDSVVAGKLTPSLGASAIDDLLEQLGAAKSAIDRHPRRDMPARQIAIELAFRVARVFEDEGLPVSSTVAGTGSAADSSSLVRGLRETGDAIGLKLAEKTWSEYVQKAVRQGALRKTKDKPGKTSAAKRDGANASHAVDLVIAWGLRKK